MPRPNLPRTLRARYLQGVFVPAAPVDLPEGSEVTLEVRMPLKQ
jgi:predicted DNA-binding antitoxin AbrB/MazE fold protein